MSHSEGFKALEVVLAYVEQQGEATATGVMLLRCWCSFTTKKGGKAGKQISETHFFQQLTYQICSYT
jgi:hypothetical protein